MSYIGNTVTTQGFTPAVDFFSGNASTTAFTLSKPVASVAQVQAVIENVPQNPGSAYTVSGNTITFTSAPPSGTNNIYVYYTSPITQVIQPSQGTVNTAQLGTINNITSGTGSALTLQTNSGTTAMTIDTSQNVGIGTSSITDGQGFGRAVNITNGSTGGAVYLQTSTSTNYGWLGKYNSSTQLGDSGSAGLIFYTGNGSGSVAERMRIDSSGNVGIGTNSPTGRLNIKSTYVSDTTVQQRFEDNTGSALNFGGTSGGVKWLNVADVTSPSTAYPLAFQTGSTERMRIDSSGRLLYGITSTYNGSCTIQQRNSVDNNQVFSLSNSSTTAPYIAYWEYPNAAPNNTASYFLQCNDSGGIRVKFLSNGGLGNYSANNINLSDRREKTNFAPAKPYLDTICAIPVQTFNYIDQNMEEDPDTTLGVIAQDVQAVAPELVHETDWGTKTEPRMRLSIYQTDMQYALMKSIQELKQIVDAQATEIAQLKAKVG